MIGWFTRRLPDGPGRPIVAAAWITLALFVVVAVPPAVGVDAFEVPVAAFGLLALALGFVVWIAAFVRAAARTTRGDDIVVASWVFLQGSAPKPVQRQLLGAAAAAVVVTLATMRGSPFVWLANLLPLAWCALWSAWYGTFPARPQRPGTPPPASRGTARAAPPGATRGRGR